MATDSPQDLKCDSRVCRCRMMGPAVYGTCFRRALAFAATRLVSGSSTEHRDTSPNVSIVRFAVTTDRKERQVATVCECGCEQRYVDHLGRWKRRCDCIIVPAVLTGPTKFVEVAVASPEQCMILSWGTWPRKYGQREGSNPSLGEYYDSSRHATRRHDTRRDETRRDETRRDDRRYETRRDDRRHETRRDDRRDDRRYERRDDRRRNPIDFGARYK